MWTHYPLTYNNIYLDFTSFHTIFERQTGGKLKGIYIDNSSEYGDPFEQYVVIMVLGLRGVFQ